MTNRTCKKCGITKPTSEYHKDASGSGGYRAQCKPCRNSFMAGYYADNADERKSAVQSYRDNNLELVRKRDMERYVRNRPARIELAKRHRYARRARMEGVASDAGITHSALRAIHGDDCTYCGVGMNFDRRKRGDILPTRATIEHITPISLGGSHTWSNVMLACHRCNVSRGNKDLSDWIPSITRIEASHVR